MTGVSDAGSSTQMFGRALRGLLYPAIYVGYFRRESARAFFNNGRSG
jgi:hypothetical protein